MAEHHTVLKALASDSRLEILRLLKDPATHFPEHAEADPATEGVSGNALAARLGMAPSTLSAHMRPLVASGLVGARRRGGWVFYRRKNKAIKKALKNAADAI